jgi:hypothetical protein
MNDERIYHQRLDNHVEEVHVEMRIIFQHLINLLQLIDMIMEHKLSQIHRPKEKLLIQKMK